MAVLNSLKSTLFHKHKTCNNVILNYKNSEPSNNSKRNRKCLNTVLCIVLLQSVVKSVYSGSYSTRSSCCPCLYSCFI